MTITWSIGVGSSSKNLCRQVAPLASKAVLRRAPSSSAAWLSRSGLRPVRMNMGTLGPGWLISLTGHPGKMW